MLIRLSWTSVFGVTPDRTKEEEFLIDNDYVHLLDEAGQLDKWRASPVVGDVLRDPTSTFRGLNRPGNPAQFANGLIYCGKPTEIIGENGSMPPPTGYVLAVYVIFNEEKDSLQAYDWDWKEEDRDMPGYPRDWDKDYGDPIWHPRAP